MLRHGVLVIALHVVGVGQRLVGIHGHAGNVARRHVWVLWQPCLL